MSNIDPKTHLSELITELCDSLIETYQEHENGLAVGYSTVKVERVLPDGRVFRLVLDAPEIKN